MINNKRILIVASSLLLVVILLASVIIYNKRKSVCSGTDKLDADGLCIADTPGGCKYEPKLGPTAALC